MGILIKAPTRRRETGIAAVAPVTIVARMTLPIVASKIRFGVLI